jgi:hyperosmotically inducible protein
MMASWTIRSGLYPNEGINMNTKLAATCLLVGSMLAPMLVHAEGDIDKSHPVVFLADSGITAKIKTKLAAEHLKSLAHIKVDTDDKGVVWLGGSASTQHQVDRAGEIAHDTEGVRFVKNNIVVREED